MTRAIAGELTWRAGRLEPGLAVLISDGRIGGVVDRSAVGADVVLEEWERCALVPGTVNAHGHAFQNLLKGFADDRPFDSWRDDVLYPFSERLSADDIYAGALFAFAEAALAGVTTIVDFFYLHDGGNENARQVIRAACAVGIRLVLARAFYDPDAPTGAPGRYRESASDAADRLRALAAAYRDDEMVSVHPAPHSLHAASPETIRIALDVAEELGVPCHLHLAEARYEVAQVEERYELTPVRLLEREGLLRPNLVTIHTVWVDDEELDLLAASGASVVHCPGANAFLGDGMARLPDMLRRGIRVALGPDGGCANNRQSVFEEMRLASLIAKGRAADGAALDAATAFELGTRAGGEILGLAVGTLEPGAGADIVGLDLDDLSLLPRGEVERHIVNSMQPSAVRHVVAGGRDVVRDGRLQGVSEAEVAEAVDAATAGWRRP